MASSISLSKNAVRTTTPSLKKTIQLYKSQLLRLETKHEQLLQKRASVSSRGFVILDENKTASSRPARHTVASPSRRGGAPIVKAIEASVQVEITSQLKGTKTEKSKLQQTLVEQTEGYHSDVNSLISTATSIVIESVELRLGFLRDILLKLNTLYHEAPKLPTPPELGYQRYEEWVGSNQRLLELNAQLYDIERLKFELKQKKSAAQKVKKSKLGEDPGSLFLKSSVDRIQSFMSRFSFQTPLEDRTATYLQELLNPRGDKTTLEAQKIQEYVRLCLSNIDTPTDTVIGAHPESYRQFMAVLCSYIVEKQREVQGEQLPHALVYSTVERHLMPQILPAIIRHVATRDRDAIIEKQCDRYAVVTLSQLKIKDNLHSNELVPFLESITQLRASYFSPTPTDKMYAVVAAAKALYERLGAMGESSIDGDSFLDLWVYVILRAKVKDLATNLQFMAEYGNPTLSLDEAGYYLTCLEAAVTFIESLEPHQLDITGVATDFVVCECSKFEELSAHPSASFQVLNSRAELLGYRVGVVRDWALNRAKLVSAVLIATGDSSDVAIVSVIRFSLDHSSVPYTEYLTDALREVGASLNGLSCSPTPLGLAAIADTANMNPHSLLVLPTGDYDAHQPQLMHILQLIRLGSKEREDVSLALVPNTITSQSVENGYLYVGTPNAATMPMAIKKNRFRVNSDGSWLSLSNDRYGYSEDRRAASFTESTAYNASPYLVGMKSEVSLNTLPFSSPEKQRKAGGRQSPGWFGRKFKSQKEKNRDRQVWHSTSDDRHQDMRSHDSNGEITREYPSSKTKYTVSGEYYDGYASVPSVENSPVHRNGRNETVEVEVHESIHRSHTLDSVVIGNQNNSNHSFQNALFASSIEFNKSQEQSRNFSQKAPTSLGVVHASLHSGSGNASGDGLFKNDNGEIGTGQFGTSPTLSLSSQQSVSLAGDPFLTISAHFFSEENTRFLEGNFLLNHLVSGDYDAVRESMTTIIRQAQLFLQRLNYLSSSHRLDGLYSDSTLSSVQRFQTSHNTHRSTPLLTLPENGLLTPPTIQYLRQALLTLYANMIRLGFDKHLGVNFDPVSTDVRNVDLFKECVQKFQESNNLIGRCQLGVLCSDTVNKMRHVLRTEKH